MGGSNENGMEMLELIPGRLFFVVIDEGKQLPYSDDTNLYFTTDDSFIYSALKDDVGPLNLGYIYKYCKLLSERLEDPSNGHKKLYHTTNGTEAKRTNSALLVCSYMIIVERKPPSEVYAPFSDLRHSMTTYHDCWKSTGVPGVSLLDCLRGLHKALTHTFFDFQSFDVKEYDHHQEINNGDMNWIVPGKILAFKGPRTTPKNQIAFTPEFYLPLLQKLGVTAVVRLNKVHYDKLTFTSNGINHYDYYFGDGTIPEEQIVDELLALIEKEPGAVAVHCKGGIGRTGTIIACYLMKNHNFDAHEAVAWIRICRPGSVMGQQHLFLQKLHQAGKRRGTNEFHIPDNAALNRPRRNTGNLEKVEYHAPEDSLKIYVLVGKDLVPEGTASDLRLEVTYEGHKHETKSIKDDNAPYWDEAVRIPAKQMKGLVRFEVKNRKAADQVTGWAEMKLEEIPPIFDDWVRLQSPKGDGSIMGEIRVTIANEIGLK